MCYRLVRPAVAALCLLLVAGCGGSGLGRVSGKVTYNGQPLAQGTITLQPAGGRPAYGKIKDGQIVEVTTERLNDGAAVGKHAVTIQAVSNPDKMDAPHKSLIPDRYGNAEQSGLTADIKPGDNVLTFDLKK